jgi:hypothetical protein
MTTKILKGQLSSSTVSQSETLETSSKIQIGCSWDFTLDFKVFSGCWLRQSLDLTICC